MASKDEQINALLTGTAYQLAARELQVSNMTRHHYEQVLTVTRDEIEAYVQIHGLPQVWCDVPDHTWGEGLEYWEKNGKWHLFWLEKGERHGEKIFDNEQESRHALLDQILAMSGTGIDYSRTQDRSVKNGNANSD